MPKGIFKRKIIPNEQRFWALVDKTPTCWLWTGNVNHKGYGLFAMRLPDGKYKPVSAHVFAYELANGPVPFGKVLDHVECDMPPCVNPGHMKPETNRANVLRGNGPTARNARKTHCKNGHEFTEANIYRKADGTRECRTCKAQLQKNRIRRMKS